MKINLRSITVMLGLLAVLSIMVPTQMQTQTFASTEPRTLDIEEVGDDDSNAEMLLMTIKEGNRKSEKVDGFRLGPDNVIFVEIGKNVHVTDDERFFRAVVTDTKDNDKQVPISQQGVIDLKGIKQGAYTLDVVIQDGNRKIAYEVVLYIGPDNDTNRNTANKEVERVNKDVTINKKIIKIEKNVTECGKGTRFSEKTQKCEIIPPTKTPTPPPKDKPTPPPAGQKPTTGTTDGKAPPACTTPDGKPGQIGLTDGKPTCTAIDAAKPGPGTPPTKPVTPPSPQPPVGGTGGAGGAGPGESCTLADGRPGRITGTQAQGNLNCVSTADNRGATTAPTGPAGSDCNLPGGNTGGKVTNTQNGLACIAGTKPPAPAPAPAPSPGGPPAGTTKTPTPPAGGVPPGGPTGTPGGPGPLGGAPGGPTPGGPGAPAPGPGGPAKPPVNCMQNPTHQDCVDDPTKGPKGTFWAGPDTQVIPGPDGTLTLKRPGQPDVTLPPLSIPGFSAKPGWTWKVTPGSHITLFPPLWGTGLPGDPQQLAQPPAGAPAPGGAVGQGAATLPPDQPGIAGIQPAPPTLPPDTTIPTPPPAGQGPVGGVPPGPVQGPPPVPDSPADAFPKGTTLTRYPDGTLVAAPPGGKAIMLKPTASGIFMPSQNPDGTINIGSPLGLPVKPGSVDIAPSGLDPAQGRPVPVESLPKATTTIEPGATGDAVGAGTAGFVAPTPETPTEPTETETPPPQTPITQPAPSTPGDGGATTEPIPDPVPTEPPIPTEEPTGEIPPGEEVPPQGPIADLRPQPGEEVPPEEPPIPTAEPEPGAETLPPDPGTTQDVRPQPGAGEEPAPDIEPPIETPPTEDPASAGNTGEAAPTPVPEPDPDASAGNTGQAAEPPAPLPDETQTLPGDTETEPTIPEPQTPPAEEDLLFGDPTTEAVPPPEGTDDYDDGSSGGAARTLPGQQGDTEDNGSGNLVPPGGEDDNESDGGLVPPTPDTTAEGGMEDTDVPPLGSTMDETNPQDRPAAPPIEAPPATPADPVDPCLVDPTLPDCNPADPPELDCESQGMEEEDGQCVLPELEQEQEQAPMEDFAPQEELVAPEPEFEEPEQESDDSDEADVDVSSEGGDEGEE